MGQVDYVHQTVKSPNPMVRFSHGKRFGASVRLADAHLQQGASLLDFGAGGMTFLQRMASARPDVELFGYDPHKPLEDPTIRFTVVDDLDVLPRESFDAITAFEVLEHLSDEDVDAFIQFAKSHVSDDGHIFVSVPIMIGPILVPKYLNARFVKRSAWRYSTRELVGAAFLGRPVPRYWHGYMNTHKGFDWRDLRRRLTVDLTLVGEQLSPFPKLHYAGLNSQWIAVLQKRPA